MVKRIRHTFLIIFSNTQRWYAVLMLGTCDTSWKERDKGDSGNIYISVHLRLVCFSRGGLFSIVVYAAAMSAPQLAYRIFSLCLLLFIDFVVCYVFKVSQGSHPARLAQCERHGACNAHWQLQSADREG
jgi:hypothetical protein